MRYFQNEVISCSDGAVTERFSSIPEDAMAFTEFTDTALVELVYNLPSGQRAENTLYFLNVGGFSTSDMTALAEELATVWEADFAPFVHDGVELDFIRVTDMNSDTAPSIEVLTSVAGDAAGANMPGNVTGAVSFKTALRGRSYRGRNYVVGLMDAHIVNDTIDAGVVAGYENAYASLNAAALALGWTHVVASKQHDGVLFNPGTTTPVTSYRMENHIDSQRRRLFGRGG